ncbi:holo-ACP synthase [Flexivirga alba]|jgi:phosphopantethiene--protein transferase domain|uniref:Holo-ACP synthase n=1 Tax=Flexivirga alba TaxID=702742 RepID=A0ABW2AH61_9MICO
MTDTDPRSPSDARHSRALPFNVRVGTETRDVSSVEASIRRHGRTFLDRTFTAQEIHTCGGYDTEPHLLAARLAGRFCAKEAALKMLRPTAIMPEWLDMEVVGVPGGWLRLNLTGIALQIAEERGIGDVQVSISQDGSVAVATVIGVERSLDEAG